MARLVPDAQDGAEDHVGEQEKAVVDKQDHGLAAFPERAQAAGEGEAFPSQRAQQGPARRALESRKELRMALAKSQGIWAFCSLVMVRLGLILSAFIQGSAKRVGEYQSQLRKKLATAMARSWGI
jgi:hypothetical protein